MSFKLEKEMLQPVKSWFSKRQELVKEELKVPWGYCDLAGCSFNKNSVSERMKLGQRKPIGPHSRVQLLWEVPDKETHDSISQEQLFEVYQGIRAKEDLEQDLKYLEDRNFLTRDSNGYYQKFNGWFPLHSEIVAIELKLKNVKQAIQQARAHLSYADSSYVALPRPLAEKVSTSNNKQIFSELGLGLLGVSPNWCQTIIHPSSKKPTKTVLQAYCVERFWREYSRNS